MHLSKLRIWNFRKYGISGEEFDTAEPGLTVNLHKGLNVLLGENDSGKTTIVDAIRYTLFTQSNDWISVEEDDFHNGTDSLKIECVFREFSVEEAAPFLEWMGFEGDDDSPSYVLTMRFTAQRKPDRIIKDWRAGPDPIGSPMEAAARDLLRTAYLKPLRDADVELAPGRRSRLAQILKAHPAFQKVPGDEHALEQIMDEANTAVRAHFTNEGEHQKTEEKAEEKDLDLHDVEVENTKGTANETPSDSGAILTKINEFLSAFFPIPDPLTADISITSFSLSDILRRLKLSFQDKIPGLGSMNLLYIAAELLLLESIVTSGNRFALVEELEAHIHPQSQLRLIDFLTNQAKRSQFLLTSHSTTLGSSIPLSNLILCVGDCAYAMGPEYTMLDPKNYEFLERFLDATKANLFFARSVILVEGDAENLLLPTIAKLLDRPLHRYGVSIVNVGSTAFLHYCKIFHRKNESEHFPIPVAVVTDIDVRPIEANSEKELDRTIEVVEEEKHRKRKSLEENFDYQSVKSFIAPNWTLEYEIALSDLRRDLYWSVLWAEKKANSSSGIPQDGKFAEVTGKVDADFSAWNEQWSGSGRKDEKIANKIYSNTMLGKRISKTITAQVLAEQILKKSEQVRTALLSNPSLKYLVDAIEYVTESIERPSNV